MRVSFEFIKELVAGTEVHEWKPEFSANSMSLFVVTTGERALVDKWFTDLAAYLANELKPLEVRGTNRSVRINTKIPVIIYAVTNELEARGHTSIGAVVDNKMLISEGFQRTLYNTQLTAKYSKFPSCSLTVDLEI
jgi:hypothetical protein